MPFWFIILAGLAAIGAIAAQSGDLVLVTTLLSFGLMVPVWYLAANLWWMLPVAAPLVWSFRHGKWLLGLGISAVLLAVPVAVLHQQITDSRAALAAPLAQYEPGLAARGGLPQSVEIQAPDQSNLSDVGRDCDDICEGLLLGPDVQWVRVDRTATKGDVKPAPLIYYRADPGACLALDADFPANAACILSRPDDGQQAELRLVLAETGAGYGPLETDPPLVYLTGQQDMTLYDQRRGGEIVAQTRRLFWTEPKVGLLSPGMTALGSGRKADGLFLPRMRDSDPALDAGAFLARAGLPLTPPRATLPSQAFQYGRKTLTEGRPYDAALLLTVAQRAHPPLGQAQLRAFDDLLRMLTETGQARPAELALLKLIGQDNTLAPGSLTRLLAAHPDWFIADMATLYDTVIHGSDAQSQDAAMKLLTILRTHEPGTYAADGPEFLAALASGRQDEALIQLAGYYGFDPAPTFRSWLATRPDMGWLVISAICRSAPSHAESLAPLVHDLMLAQMPRVLGFSDNLQGGAQTLARLGRADLIKDIEARIDWAAMRTAKQPNFSGITLTEDKLRQVILGPRDPAQLVNRQCP
jgi:hypothetical protein